MIHDDDKLIKEILEKREWVEKATILIAFGFLFNCIATFLQLKIYLENSEEHSYLEYAVIYGENVLVIFVVIYLFNKFKF